jgi:nucleoside-diphosphate-sugar epimerase
VNEEAPLDKDNTNSPLLLATEELLKNRFSQLTIIRPGGLYGFDRHPVNFLATKKNLPGGNDWLHLVHMKDCINAILSIIENNQWGKTYNLVSDLKIKKKDYYTQMASKLSLESPVYIDERSESPTQISNEKSKNELKISYMDPLDYKRGSL